MHRRYRRPRLASAAALPWMSAAARALLVAEATATHAQAPRLSHVGTHPAAAVAGAASSPPVGDLEIVFPFGEDYGALADEASAQARACKAAVMTSSSTAPPAAPAPLGAAMGRLSLALPRSAPMEVTRASAAIGIPRADGERTATVAAALAPASAKQGGTFVMPRIWEETSDEPPVRARRRACAYARYACRHGSFTC